ncbi:hypothetical protein B4N89_02445 [Embleya scabrispora]|uniref:Uncharacterized protein n=1 Tax=Embleya scabrispora TaxID=159449 RepID=A0A1T3NST7_9ACTN|nr:hypothetical protein [Embleya scabrispora]OPC79957.1 hypothetical protein B4N89_02445 [Embleya scabrispora]
MSKPHVLPKGMVPAIKLDTASAAAIAEGLTDAQARGLFTYLTTSTLIVAEVRAYRRDEDVENDKKPASVTLRIVQAEAAFDRAEQETLRKVMAAMYRRRWMAGTIDELGDGPDDPAVLLEEAFAGHPTEEEYRAYIRKPATPARS